MGRVEQGGASGASLAPSPPEIPDIHARSADSDALNSPVEADPAAPGYRKTAVRGAVVTGAGTLSKAVLQVLAIVVLARLLSPEDFGVMAMVFPIIAFATIFQQAGLGLAVLQRDSISDEELSTVFWVNLAIGVLLCGLLVAVSPLVAAFYDEPRVQALTAASGTLMIIGGLSSQHIILLMRRMAYGRLAVMDALSLIIGTAVAIAWAAAFDSYWAIFLLSFGTQASMCLLAWAFSRWLPARGVPVRQIKDILLFGGNITLSNLATYFGQNLDKILIGRTVGAVALGYYERAYKVVLLPVLFVHMPLFRLLVPMLSQSRREPERYRKLFVTGYQLSLLITVPGTVLLIASAAQVVLFVLGPQWVEAAPIFAWLAVASLGQLVMGPLNMLLVSQGRSKEAMLSSVVSSLFSSLAFVAGLPWGAVGVAMAFAISELLRAPVMLWYVTREGPVTLREAALSLAPFLFAALVGGAILAAWSQRLDSASSALLFIVAAGAAVYALTFLSLLLNRSGRAFVAELGTVLRSALRR